MLLLRKFISNSNSLSTQWTHLEKTRLFSQFSILKNIVCVPVFQHLHLPLSRFTAVPVPVSTFSHVHRWQQTFLSHLLYPWVPPLSRKETFLPCTRLYCYYFCYYFYCVKKNINPCHSITVEIMSFWDIQSPLHPRFCHLSSCKPSVGDYVLYIMYMTFTRHLAEIKTSCMAHQSLRSLFAMLCIELVILKVVQL